MTMITGLAELKPHIANPLSLLPFVSSVLIGEPVSIAFSAGRFCSAMADIVISRAGANAICELLTLRKPNLLIPLPAWQTDLSDHLLRTQTVCNPLC